MSQHVVLGSGPAGTALAAELGRRGHEVRVVNRGGEAGARAADLLNEDEARAAVAGAEVVYHCVNVAYHRQVELMPRIQRSVLAAAEDAGARLVVLDTLYPYGNTGGATMTEETPWGATGRKGRMRAELDRGYLEAHRSGRVSTVLGRSADFFGPGVFSSTLGATVFPPALTGGEVMALGNIDLEHSYTYIRDVAAGLATLGERPEGDGRVWHLPTAPAVSTRRMHELIAERTGSPLNVVVYEEPRAVGPFDEVFMAEYAELFYQHTERQVMDSSAFERTFGVVPTALGPALDATVDWFRAALAAPQH